MLGYLSEAWFFFPNYSFCYSEIKIYWYVLKFPKLYLLWIYSTVETIQSIFKNFINLGGGDIG